MLIEGVPDLTDDLLGDLQKRVAVREQDKGILQEIAEERIRQDDKWGEQNHLDGTGDPYWTDNISPHEDVRSAQWIAELAKARCGSKALQGKLTFLDIALEEIAEAFAETDPDLLRAELVQSAAVLVNWIGAIDRRADKAEEHDVQT